MANELTKNVIFHDCDGLLCNKGNLKKYTGVLTNESIHNTIHYRICSNFDEPFRCRNVKYGYSSQRHAKRFDEEEGTYEYG